MTAQGRLLSILITVFGWLPLRANQAVGAGLGWLLYRIPNRSRDVARRNLELCFPDQDPAERERWVRGSLRAIGQGLTELGWVYRRPRERMMERVREIHGLEHLDAALEQDRGVLLAAPHVGSFELLGQYLTTRTRCAYLYAQPKDPGIEQVIVRGRTRTGAELIKADAGGVRRVFKVAAEHKLIGILPDQQPKKGQGEFAPFFGIPALTMVLFSKLAGRTGMPVLFGFAERLPAARGFDLHFFPADPDIASDDMQRSLAALNRGVEQCVATCPEQYAWGYKRFSIRPEGEPTLY